MRDRLRRLLSRFSKFAKQSHVDKSTMEEAWRRSTLGLHCIVVISVFINILRLTIPIYLLQLLDRVVASGSQETLVMLSIIALFAALCHSILEAIRRKLFINWSIWIEQTFGTQLFVKSFHDKPDETATSKYLRYLTTIRKFLSGKGATAWIDLTWTPIFVLSIYFISPTLGVITFLGCLIAVFLGLVNERMTRDSRNSSLKAQKNDRCWIAAAEQHKETLAHDSFVANVAQRWSDSANERAKHSLKTQQRNIGMESSMRFVGRFLRIAVLGVGIWLVNKGAITLGSVFACSVLTRTAYSLMESAMMRWLLLSNAKQAYNGIRLALNDTSTKNISVPKKNASQKLILDDVSYRYQNQKSSVFRAIKTALMPGQMLYLVGPSGAGKTTLARLSAGLLPARSGKILLNDADVYTLQRVPDLKLIGWLPQYTNLFKGTVRENIAGLHLGDIDKVVQAAKLVGIHEAILKLPFGYDTEIVDNEPLLSAGQRRQVAIARAFYDSPPLIVLDEPTANIDRKGKSTFRSAVKSLLNQGCIMVITTQEYSTSKDADQIIELTDKGYRILKQEDDIIRLSTGIRNSSKKGKVNPL